MLRVSVLDQPSATSTPTTMVEVAPRNGHSPVAVSRARAPRHAPTDDPPLTEELISVNVGNLRHDRDQGTYTFLEVTVRESRVMPCSRAARRKASTRRIVLPWEPHRSHESAIIERYRKSSVIGAIAIIALYRVLPRGTATQHDATLARSVAGRPNTVATPVQVIGARGMNQVVIFA